VGSSLRRAPGVAPLALLAACALGACGTDPQVSLGSVAQAVPPLGPDAADGAGAPGAAGRATTSIAGASSAPPAPPDAGPPPAPPDAGPGPGQEPPASPCSAPRIYRGDFACTLRFDPSMVFQPPPAGAPLPASRTMNTTLTFGLEPDASGTSATIAQGAFMFLAWELAFMGTLEGQLDCQTGRFEATIADGMTGAVFGMPMTFDGELSGMVVDEVGSLQGTWWHGPSQDPINSGCTGPWTAAPL
jgi:hypothetical protein